MPMPTVKAMMEETKIDIRHWNQYNKLAVISDKDGLGTIINLGDHLQGIQARHFQLDEMNRARDWIQE